MKKAFHAGLLAPILWVLLASPARLHAQACKDEEEFALEYKKGLNDLVETVKKESLGDFQKAYHQKSCLTKQILTLGAVNELENCLEKAVQDPAATKEQADAYKSKHDSYAKLKEKITQDRNALKATEAPKEAKPLIEKFDYGK